jgi:transposase
VPEDDQSKLLSLQRELEIQKQLLAGKDSIIEELRNQIEKLVSEVAALRVQLHEALKGDSEQKQQIQEKLDDLLFQLKNLKREKYGRKTERQDPKQGPDNDEPEDHSEGVSARLKKKATEEKRPRNHKKHINEQELPEQPFKYDVKPGEIICPHCQVETEFLKYVKTSLIERAINALIRVTQEQEVRACPKCDYIVSAEKPCPPIPGSYAGPSLLSSVVVDKFADALPNYRQAKRFRRQNVIIPRSTQCDWIIAGSLTIEPLYEQLMREVLSSKLVRTDDTWAKIQDRRLPGKMRKGKMTAYLGDENHPLNFFVFSPDLTFKTNKETLKDFKGYVQADAAGGFDALFQEDSGRTEIGCNAHARRKFWQCAEEEAYEVVAGEILEIYRELYQVEKEYRNRNPEQRLAARQERSKPLTAKLHAKLLVIKDSLNPTNPLMKAVAYTLNHWDALVRFLEDPDFPVDNNDTEQAIKSWVLVRKNALHVGSDAGGKAAAIHLSFISSCNRLGIDPLEYLTDIYSRINETKTSELRQLLPDLWVQNRACKPPP